MIAAHRQKAVAAVQQAVTAAPCRESFSDAGWQRDEVGCGEEKAPAFRCVSRTRRRALLFAAEEAAVVFAAPALAACAPPLLSSRLSVAKEFVRWTRSVETAAEAREEQSVRWRCGMVLDFPALAACAPPLLSSRLSVAKEFVRWT